MTSAMLGAANRWSTHNASFASPSGKLANNPCNVDFSVVIGERAIYSREWASSASYTRFTYERGLRMSYPRARR